MNEKKIIIVGAGISGLSAGCYLQMNGFQTEIFELHNIPGGLCTAWKRKGYTFDFCIHWLMGSSPADGFYNLWNELIDMEKQSFVYSDVFFQIEDREGRTLSIFTDIDRLEEEMKRVAPEDTALIEDFTGGIRKFLKFEFPLDKAQELMNPWDGLKMMARMIPYFRAFKKWDGISAREFAGRFQNPLLRQAIPEMFLEDTSVFFLLMTLAGMHKRSSGYPIGGSLPFARSIEKKYLDLGGKLHYNSRVTRIIVENDRARGVEIADGDTRRADFVISAADGYSTIFRMLEGKYVNDKIEDYYNDRSGKLKVFPSLVFVSLGVGRKFEDQPPALVFPLKQPITVDENTSQDQLAVRIFNFDPTLAPEGKTALTVGLGTYNHDYWVKLRKGDGEKYRQEKSRIAYEVIEALEARFGNFKSQVEVVDVSTPATLIRYTDNWKGSFEGWQPNPGAMMMRVDKTLPGLKNFHMISQWVNPGGGLPPAILSGRNVAQIICKQTGKTFTVRK